MIIAGFMPALLLGAGGLDFAGLQRLQAMLQRFF